MKTRTNENTNQVANNTASETSDATEKSLPKQAVKRLNTLVPSLPVPKPEKKKKTSPRKPRGVKQVDINGQTIVRPIITWD